jgi:hypothetical protein
VGERCELKSTGTLQGDLKAPRLVIEEGATFIGKSNLTNDTLAGEFNRAKPDNVQHEELCAPSSRHRLHSSFHFALRVGLNLCHDLLVFRKASAIYLWWIHSG